MPMPMMTIAMRTAVALKTRRGGSSSCWAMRPLMLAAAFCGARG